MEKDGLGSWLLLFFYGVGIEDVLWTLWSFSHFVVHATMIVRLDKRLLCQGCGRLC